MAGLTVAIAKRVCSLAGPGEVLVSPTAAGVVAASGIKSTDRGEQELKGAPGIWRLISAEC